VLDSERFVVKSVLDTLADILRVTRLDASQANVYFDSLKKYSHERFLAAVKRLQENYEPKRSNDFPVLKVFHQACTAIVVGEKNPTWDCRCCKKPYPAGSERLNCDCLIWDHCFKCDKCHKHCPCNPSERISVEQISASCVAEFARILSTMPNQKRSRPESSALKKAVLPPPKLVRKQPTEQK